MRQHDHEAELVAYEEKVQNSLRSQKIIALCSYPLAKCSAAQFLQTINSHDCALVRRQGGWECVESESGRRLLSHLRKRGISLRSMARSRTLSPFTMRPSRSSLVMLVSNANFFGDSVICAVDGVAAWQ